MHAPSAEFLLLFYDEEEHAFLQLTELIISNNERVKWLTILTEQLTATKWKTLNKYNYSVFMCVNSEQNLDFANYSSQPITVIAVSL